jgi:hypothetical protein
MAPVVIGLLMAATWVLEPCGAPAGSTDALLWLLAAVVAVLVWRTRLHLLWLLAAGACWVRWAGSEGRSRPILSPLLSVCCCLGGWRRFAAAVLIQHR